MSTFYLLPPRPVLGARFADYLSTLFPGLNWASLGWPELVEILNAAACRHPDAFFVYRDDLPEGEVPERALMENFGAEKGDEVVEVCTGGDRAGMNSRRWQL